ncbi:uncharacterized protein LOC112565953 [Pomacea canaliculata]|uniref:uncharacterized protein LOC112565953 n=1 Tax=Pomacea canaliculata TaxID=400727 RepID=UPI000D73FF4E|nr:uncharacterized protein LOC112565953 [Pomacea canaliculata]
MNNSEIDDIVPPWSHPDNIVHYKAVAEIELFYHVVLKPAVLVLAVVTNIINCIVFRRQGLMDRMNLCLFVLSLVDMTYLVYSMTFSITYWIKLSDLEVGDFIYYSARCYGMGVSYGLRETSSCINTVIAVERCLCVLFPLRAKYLVSTTTMGILLVAIVITMQVAFVTNPIKNFIFQANDGDTNETWWNQTLSDSWQKNEFLRAYDKIEDTVMQIVLPVLNFLLVSGATAITVVSLRAAILWRQKTSSANSEAYFQQVALTKMLVLVSCAFVTSKLPMISITITRIVHPSFAPSGCQYNLYKVFEMMSRYFPYLHSSCTFFIYYFSSLRFRTEVQRIWGCVYKSMFFARANQSTRLAFQ